MRQSTIKRILNCFHDCFNKTIIKVVLVGYEMIIYQEIIYCNENEIQKTTSFQKEDRALQNPISTILHLQKPVTLNEL